MRVFVAGATGVIGIRIVPLLVADGHVVAGMTRTPGKLGLLRELGAEPVLCDVFDVAELERVVGAFVPEVVLHELTDLPDDAARIPEVIDRQVRIRRDGTRNLLRAASLAGASRILAQSVAWKLEGDGGEAMADLERQVLAADGCVLRYGQFYGPGTYFPAEPPGPPRIHVDEAARRTVELLDAGRGIVEIVEGQD